MDITHLVENYHPPVEVIRAIKHAKIALLVGISGAGKDTIKHALLRRPEFRAIISHTTRAPRYNEGVLEQEGVDYHFISLERSLQMLQNNQFLEAKLVHGTVYGTSIEEVQRASHGAVAINDVDVQGVAEYKAVSDQVVAIFVVPPSYDTWLDRLKRRYATEHEFHTEWPRRRESAIAELTKALEVPYYHCVINDDIERAVDVSAEIALRPDIFTRKDDEARLAARDLLQQILM